MADNRLGSFDGAAQIAGVNRIDFFWRKAVSQGCGLSSASFAQRNIRLPLKTTLAVPFGFTVTDQDESSHYCIR